MTLLGRHGIPSMRPRSSGARPVVATALVLALVACSPRSELAEAARQMTAIESGDPFMVPEVELTGRDGSPYNLREGLQGRFALLFFGYTHCPDVCPISMAVVTRAVQRLDDFERDRVQPVFVSVDYGRDTPERIDEWLDAMGSTAVGLTGSRAELEAALDPMRVHVATGADRRPMEGMEDMAHEVYLLPHPSSVFLITPDGLGRFLYAYGRATPEEMVADVRRLMALDW